MEKEETTLATQAFEAIEQPPVLWVETQRLLCEVEAQLGGPVMSYYTGTDARIHDDDVKYFFTHLKKIGFQKKLFFIVVSHGGNGQSAWRIACLLRSFCEELTIVLPEAAASAGTILSLAADKIIMTPLSYLTAVDTSLYHPLNPKDADNKPVYVELDEVNRSVRALLKNRPTVHDRHEVYKTIFNYIHPVAFGAIARSTNLSEMLCSDMMELRRNPPNAEIRKSIIRKLNEEYPSHSYPIPRHKALQIGLPVRYSSTMLDETLSSLLTTYVYLTRAVKSYLNKSCIHTEAVTTVIESSSLRFTLHHTHEKRLDEILKDWFIFKNEFRWQSLRHEVHHGNDQVIRSDL